jgi:hypothetical protein
MQFIRYNLSIGRGSSGNIGEMGIGTRCMTTAKALILIGGLILTTATTSANPAPVKPDCTTAPGVCLKSLEELSTEALRQREYHSTLKTLHKVARKDKLRAYMLGYQSDSLAL